MTIATKPCYACGHHNPVAKHKCAACGHNNRHPKWSDVKERRETCFGCKNLAKQKIAMGGCVAYCAVDNSIVPQHFQSNPPEITYWRIPLDCPLPDSEVKKSETKANKKKWVIEKL